MNFEDLLRDPPRVHAWIPGKLIASGLPEESFRFIYDCVGPGWRTLETGAGISTVLFAMRGARHTCIAPDEEEINRLKEYCSERGIAIDSVDFQIDRSDRFFRTHQVDLLDLVLIDGCHGFPTPFLDWFYTAAQLKVGGILVIDDTHLWTGTVLKEFLLTEPEWRLNGPRSPKTAIFVKTEDYVPWKEWNRQPYVASRSNANLPVSKSSSNLRWALKLIRQGEYSTLIKKTIKQFTG